MSAAFPSLHPRIWECIFPIFPTRFSGRELSLFTEIIHYFSSSVSSLSKKRNHSPIYAQFYTDLFLYPCSVPVFCSKCPCELWGRKIKNSHTTNWDAASLISALSSTTSRLNLCNYMWFRMLSRPDTEACSGVQVWKPVLAPVTSTAGSSSHLMTAHCTSHTI